MTEPLTPGSVRSALRELGISPSKGRGQNFLIDDGVVRSIAAHARIQQDERVIEVGPGLGALTRHLLGRSATFVAVELEDAFAGYLLRSLPQLSSSQIIRRDVRTVSLRGPELAPFGPPPFVVISNVPYSISSEFFLWLVENRAAVARASLLLQREFAERLAAPPGSRTYGSLSVLRALYADASLGPIVSGDRFIPPAEVESRMLELRFLPAPRIAVSDESHFERVVRSSFGQRRKTLLNSLTGSRRFGDKERVTAALRDAAIDPQRRAETLSLEEFVRLSEKLPVVSAG